MEHSEWLYSELLEILKQKEKEKDDSLYLPIELELPIAPVHDVIGDKMENNNINEEKEKDRGVVIIEL